MTGPVLINDSTYPDNVTVFLNGRRVTASCKRCRTAVTSPDSPLGRAVIDEWCRRHRHGA